MALPLRDESARTPAPWATWSLMAVCLVLYLFVQPPAFQQARADDPYGRSTQYRSAQHFVDRWGVVPCEVTHLRSIHDSAPCGGYPVDRPELYPAKSPLVPIVTSMFLHGGILHLAGNLLFLWVFGRAVEERLGSGNLVVLFVLSGIVAVLGFVAVRSESSQPMVGASGAIAGIMGAYLALAPRRRVLSVVYSAGLQVVYLPAWALLGLFFVTQFFTPGRSGVAWQAHVAGMLFGFAAGVALRRWARLRPAVAP